jgi:hypothetical protein
VLIIVAAGMLRCATLVAALLGSAGAFQLFAHVEHVEALTSDLKQIPGVPDFKAPEVFPVPTAARCTVIMCCQYFIIFTALAACRTHQEFTGSGKTKVEAGLRAAAQTATYGPMLCVLFIAYSMRVESLSDGKDEPQQWVQLCMYATTFAVLASALLVLAIPLVLGRPLELEDGTCDLEKVKEAEGESKNVFYALTACRYLILLGLYGGLAGVVLGTITYLPPGAKDLSKLPPLDATVWCSIVLAVVFFSTQLVIAACRTYAEHTGIGYPKLVGVMQGAATTVELAPMLAVLFLAARMRASQHDAQPEIWAQNCMCYSTFAMCMTTALSILVPLALGGKMKTNPVTKESTFEVPDPTIGYVLLGLRYICMFSFYGGTAGVAYSIFTFQAPAGAEATLPVSPTVQCVVNMTCQYFFVYMMMTVMLTASEVTGGTIPMERWSLFAAIEASKATLAFAPMLSILFVTTRMYALLITDNKGAPQAWVQDGMCMTTWSLMISFVMCLATGFVMDTVDTDEDGNIVNKLDNKYASIAITAIRYVSMVLLYCGMTMVIVGLFAMTPETANGRGSVPYVSEAINATPFGSAPPGLYAPSGAAAPASGAETWADRNQ